MGHITCSSAPASSPEFALRSIGARPSGVPIQEDGFCTFCGVHLKVGNLHNKFRPSAKFVDYPYLAYPESRVICGWCSVATSVSNEIGESGKAVRISYIETLANGVFSAAGKQRFGTAKEIQSFLLNPPEPPFIALYSTAKNQHMVWRARPTLDINLIHVKLGLTDIRIRRDKLFAAADAAKRLGLQMSKMWAEKTKKTYVPNDKKQLELHPFVSFSKATVKLKSEEQGHLRWRDLQEIYENAETSEEKTQIKADVDLLVGMSIGESWAIQFMLRDPNAADEAIELDDEG
jgi:CRISPR type IV-associated protein Csf1